MDASAELPLRSDEPRPPPRAPRLLRRAHALAQLMRLDRPIGIWLLLWPTLWALWIASVGHVPRRLLAIFVAGTIVMRSAGCIVNDLADRNIDPHVRRTRALQLNTLSVKLAFVGAALTISYPMLKRFFPLPQLYLGLCFGWAVPMAFAATLGFVPREGWLMLIAAVLWAGVYDTEYAMVDRDDDVRVGVQSAAILFGDMDRLMIAVMQCMMLLALVLIGRTLQFDTGYYGGLGVGAALFIWQQWLIRARDRAACLAAFQNNNYFGFAVFAGILIEYGTSR